MSFRRVVSLLLLAAYLPACTSYQATTQPVAELTVAPKAPGQVRVITTSGARIEVWSPRVMGDTLWGYAGPPSEAARVMFIPLSEIQVTEVPTFSAWKSALVAVGAALAVASVIAMVQLASDPITVTY